jgi:hypothetical protein
MDRCQSFGETYCLYLQGLRWRQCVYVWHWLQHTKLNGSKIQNDIQTILIVMKTLNLTTNFKSVSRVRRTPCYVSIQAEGIVDTTE